MKLSLRTQIKDILTLSQDAQPDKATLIDLALELKNANPPRTLIHDFLIAGHLPSVNASFYNSDKQKEWFELLLELIRKSKFHTGYLIKQRAELYPEKPLFQTIKGKQLNKITYKEIWSHIGKIARSLLEWTNETTHPVIGIFTPNSPAGALVDLACLSFNFRVVPIPVNVSKTHLEYILIHSGITHLFIGGAEPHSLFNQLPKSKWQLLITQLPNAFPLETSCQSWEHFLHKGSAIHQDQLRKQIDSVNMDAIATIMYTSGTTADPKGIIFTQTNMISKRFARALALPEISSEDTFLAYLPLFHTFGRFLELMGSIFWGATYTFAESPVFKTLLKDFSIATPTVFISIPKRWIQLYEQIENQIQLETAPVEEVQKILQKLTGGKLLWGLSAAGFLDPDIFTFYQKHGIHLLSGYGMTEATGGITMTPPEDYDWDSVGIPLPGIETKLAEDGELLLQGPYLSPGYFGKTVTPILTNGWFHTGDIFKEKKNHLYIIDRKKEIYKNSRGQTIAPQKIENMFQDFDAIKSVFLVGDGREYNTILIYPDHQQIPLDLENSSRQAIRDYFSSLVQSVNSFLAAYERIANFALINRDFSEELGELTQKHTFRRKKVLENFADIIEPMYAKNFTSLIHEETEVRIPNWLMREMGIVPTDLTWDGKTLALRNRQDKLTVQWNKDFIQAGDFRYKCPEGIFDLQKLLLSPELWLGNQPLVSFVGNSAFRISKFETPDEIQLDETSFSFQLHPVQKNVTAGLKKAFLKKQYSLEHLHNAATVMLNSKGDELPEILKLLHGIAEKVKDDLAQTAFQLLMRMRHHPSSHFRIKALEYQLPQITGELFIDLLTNAYLTPQNSISIEDLDFDDKLLQKTHFDALINHLGKFRTGEKSIDAESIPFIRILLHLITQYGIQHPTSYIWVRAELIRWQLSSLVPEQIQSIVQAAYSALTNGFRLWLGDKEHLAIDRDSGEEYSWSDAIQFDANVEKILREKLLANLSDTPALREAVFLFSKRRLIQLDDIYKNGIWITFLGRNHGKSVVRVLVQTREMESFNFVININEELDTEFIQDEIRWLINTGSSIHGAKLVEDFGGYWAKDDLYTEEYISGETLHQYLERNKQEIAGGTAVDRWQMRWLHFIWNGLMAYIDFWHRSGYTLHIVNPSPKNLIIPEYDYATGTRLISISNRVRIDKISDLFFTLFEGFIIETEQAYPGLKRMADWEVVFTSTLQVITVKKGIEFLRSLMEELQDDTTRKKAQELGLTIDRIRHFIREVNENGILTKQVVFAALRYERWLELNPEATVRARGSILQELYKDYGLRNLLDDYPETRIRFFLMTCFKDVNPRLFNRLLALQKGLRARTIAMENLEPHLLSILESVDLTKDEEFFLTRLLFEHLDAAREGELITWEIGTEGRLDLITLTEDKLGDRYRIRPPFHPKEIARFHSLLMEANLAGVFQAQHEFLLIINTNGRIIGGVYWKDIGNKTAYLEKIVIRQPYRKRHLSLNLLEELFDRLQDRRYEYVTVGFFQAGLFYRLGFEIDKKFGGLVKTLK